jgi:O-acetyl-ADP-ribose deacetylase (regulator of RNase III)
MVLSANDDEPTGHFIMPAIDRYHGVVITALIKDGWQIVKEHDKLLFGDRLLWVDLRARRTDGTAVVDYPRFSGGKEVRIS